MCVYHIFGGKGSFELFWTSIHPSDVGPSSVKLECKIGSSTDLGQEHLTMQKMQGAFGESALHVAAATATGRCRIAGNA